MTFEAAWYNEKVIIIIIANSFIPVIETVLNTFITTHLIHWGRHCSYFHFIAEEAEAKRG